MIYADIKVRTSGEIIVARGYVPPKMWRLIPNVFQAFEFLDKETLLLEVKVFVLKIFQRSTEILKEELYPGFDKYWIPQTLDIDADPHGAGPGRTRTGYNVTALRWVNITTETKEKQHVPELLCRS